MVAKKRLNERRRRLEGYINWVYASDKLEKEKVRRWLRLDEQDLTEGTSKERRWKLILGVLVDLHSSLDPDDEVTFPCLARHYFAYFRRHPKALKGYTLVQMRDQVTLSPERPAAATEEEILALAGRGIPAGFLPDVPKPSSPQEARARGKRARQLESFLRNGPFKRQRELIVARELYLTARLLGAAPYSNASRKELHALLRQWRLNAQELEQRITTRYGKKMVGRKYIPGIIARIREHLKAQGA